MHKTSPPFIVSTFISINVNTSNELYFKLFPPNNIIKANFTLFQDCIHSRGSLNQLQLRAAIKDQGKRDNSVLLLPEEDQTGKETKYIIEVKEQHSHIILTCDKRNILLIENDDRVVTPCYTMTEELEETFLSSEQATTFAISSSSIL